MTGIVYSSLFLNFFLVASFDNLGPRLSESHDITNQQLSLIIAIKSFVNMFCGPVLALLSSKIPAALLFTFGGLFVAGSMTGVAFSTNVAGFMIARSLHGIGTSGLMIGGMSVLMRSVRKKQRGKYTSIAYSAAGHAPLVAPVLSGLMYDYLGQTWAFLIIAIVTFAVVAVSYVALARVMQIPRLEQSESQLTTIEKSMIWPCIKLIFQSPMTYVAIAGILSDGFSFGCCESTLPATLVEWDHGSLSVLTTSLIYSVGPLAFTIVAPIAGFFVDKKGPQKVLLFGLFVFTVSFPLFQILAQSLVGLGACIGIAFAIMASCEVAIYPFVADIAERTEIAHADTVAYAFNELFIQGGYAVGNLCGRVLLDWNGFLAMGCFIAGWDAIALIFSLLVLTVIRRRTAAKPKPCADTADSSNHVVVSEES